MEFFGLVNTTLIEEFYWRYVVIIQATSATSTTTVIIVGFEKCRTMQYWEFNYMKPPEFTDDMDVIIALRWISNMEGCLFMCSCLDHQKVKFPLNFLC